MRIKFHVEFFLRTDEYNKCRAVVTCYLPCDESHQLVNELRDWNKVCGEMLTAYWGEYDAEREMRCAEREISGYTWDDVKEEYKKLVDKTLETLRQVYERNVRLAGEKPADFWSEFELRRDESEGLRG